MFNKLVKIVIIIGAILGTVAFILQMTAKRCESFTYKPENKKTCTLCLFGVIPRGGEKTFNSINKRIYDVLIQNGFDITVYIFNMNVEDTLVDGEKVSQTFLDKIPFKCDKYEEIKQKKFDTYIHKRCKKTLEHCKFHKAYDPATIKNALRQMYSESRIGRFLEKNSTSDVVVVCGPDYYIANDININHVNDAINSDVVYTAQVNNGGGGYTNGFYIGKPANITKITKYRLDDYKSTNKDYEYMLKSAFDKYKVPHKFTDIVFFKIRKNGEVYWQGSTKTTFLPKSEAESVNNEFDNLVNSPPYFRHVKNYQ